MIHIPSNEIKQPLLHADILGFTFVWQGHFLRGIFPDSEEWTRTYFESGFIDEIVNKGLYPRTWISDYENEQFGMIIEHEMISPALYATDWNSAMLKDAALMVLDIAEIGWRYGYNMVDSHKLNVMFKDNRPLYVDLGSFVPKEKGSTGWKPYNNFLESYTYILDVWTHGSEQIAKRMMSPGVLMRTQDYLAYKYPFFRSHPSLLSRKNKIALQLNSFAIMGYDKVKNNRIHSFLKRLIDGVKPCWSQHFNRLRRTITRLSIQSNQNKEEAYVFDYSFISPVNSITCINLCNAAIVSGIKGIADHVISLNENDKVSNAEYEQLKDITSVSFPLLNGSVLIRDKFPEIRLHSAVVIVRCADSGHGQFALHNNLVYLERCMSYSTSGTMYIWMPKPNAEMVALLKERFSLQRVSDDETLLMVHSQNQ